MPCTHAMHPNAPMHRDPKPIKKLKLKVEDDDDVDNKNKKQCR